MILSFHCPRKVWSTWARWTTPGLALFALSTISWGGIFSSDTPLVLTQIPVDSQAATRAAPPRNPLEAPWFEAARVVIVTPPGAVRVLSEGLAAACDPEVSFDGQRILFAAKAEPNSPWGIYECGTDGGERRVIASEPCDCRQPRYLSSLFTLDSPEPWYTALYVGWDGTLGECGQEASTSLYSIRLGGEERRRLTFNPNPEHDPFQMPDGRVLFSAWRGAGSLTAERRSLFGVHIDGTDLALYGASQGKRYQRMGCATDRGWVVFVEADALTPDAGGQLAAVRVARPHDSHRPLTQGGDWVYSYPAPGPGGSVLVSRRPGRGDTNWGVVALDLETGQTTPVYDTPEYHELQVQRLEARPVPDGRSTVVETQYTTGKLYGLNCCTADPALAPHLTPGSIQRLRVIEGVPAVVGNPRTSAPVDAVAFGRRLVGEAPVEADGSFHVEIPADIPVQLQTLDRDGLALATCGWIWVKPKENLGCIGCHEDPELIPENHFVKALARNPNRLTLPPENRRSVGFLEHVLPILRAKCAAADCHGAPDAPMSLASAARPDSEEGMHAIYRMLLDRDSPKRAPYVDAGRARTSPLIWNLLGRDASRPWDPESTRAAAREWTVKPMPPPKAAPLSEIEVRLLIEWIDLGAQLSTPRVQSSQAGSP